jgi:hypothetical protein
MLVCFNCGGRVGRTARFCPGCGASQKNGLGANPAPLPGTRAREPWDVCEIVWWRGYVKSEFFVHAVGADQGEYEVARSRQFWWRNSEPPPPDHKGAQAAHEALVEKLEAAGWEPLGKATPWYAQRFRRHAAGLRVLTAEEAESAPGEEGTHA